MRAPWPARGGGDDPVNNNLITKRGSRSALSACPAPGAAVVAVPSAQACLRGVGVDVYPHLGTVAPRLWGTGLPAAVPAQGTRPSIAGWLGADISAMPFQTFVQFVQLHPGDRARRPPG